LKIDPLHIGRPSETAERRAQKAVAVSFWLLAPYIAVQAIRDLAAHHPASASPLGIALTASSLVIMPVLGIAKRRLGERLGRPAAVRSPLRALARRRPGRPA